MRIISGSKKKMKLFAPTTDLIRPTTDRAKESLFNLLGQTMDNKNFLDLFTGTGSIALEAKSRGASRVVAIDNSYESKKIIEKNIEKSKMDIEFINSDVFKAVDFLNDKFDYIFLDPPFKVFEKQIIELIDRIKLNDLLATNGTIVIERKTKKDNEILFSKYDKLEIRTYGKITFIIIGRL